MTHKRVTLSGLRNVFDQLGKGLHLSNAFQTPTEYIVNDKPSGEQDFNTLIQNQW